MPFLTSKNWTCQLCSFVQHRGHSMFAGSAEAKSQLNLTQSSSNIIQDANFIDFKYCFFFHFFFFRGGGGWKPQSWFSMSNSFMYSTSCVGEGRGWNCLFRRLFSLQRITVLPSPFRGSYFVCMSACLVNVNPGLMNPEAVDHLGLIFLTIGGLMSNWKIVVSESTVRYLKSLLFSKFTPKKILKT